MPTENTYAILAKKRINILSMVPAPNGLFVGFEYQWQDAKGHMNWSKAFASFPLSDESDWREYQTIIDIVDDIRHELEASNGD